MPPRNRCRIRLCQSLCSFRIAPLATCAGHQALLAWLDRTTIGAAKSPLRVAVVSTPHFINTFVWRPGPKRLRGSPRAIGGKSSCSEPPVLRAMTASTGPFSDLATLIQGTSSASPSDTRTVREPDTILGKMRFPTPPARRSKLEIEHVNAIRAKARELGLGSIALATVLQFELSLRQKDVIGGMGAGAAQRRRHCSQRHSVGERPAMV